MKKWGLGLVLVAGILSGCGSGSGHFALRYWSQTKRVVPCQCPYDTAVTYAKQATQGFERPAEFYNRPTLDVVINNPDGRTLTRLNVRIQPTRGSTTRVLVRAISSPFQDQEDERAAEAFVTAFGKAAGNKAEKQGTP